MPRFEPYGDLVPSGDPSWYEGKPTLHYNETHVAFRQHIRDWVETNMKPYIQEWDEAEEVDSKLFSKFAEEGFLALMVGKEIQPYTDKWIKSVPFDKADAFHKHILGDELSRCGSAGACSAITVGVSVGLPPVLHHGSEELKRKIIPAVIRGDKRICLAITEPEAGSDVAGIVTTAEKTPDGKHYVVNGMKKWITNGIYSDYFTVAVRTGGPGMAGISLLLIERGPGVETDKIYTQGMRASGSTLVSFDNVKVPVENLLGVENGGFRSILSNFVAERLGAATHAVRYSRVCIEEALKYSQVRYTFGQPLFKHPVIRQKLASMSSRVEAVAHWVENLYYLKNQMSDEEAMVRLGAPAAGCKALSSQTFEYVAREAMHILGSIAYTKGGKGATVEILYRDVRSTAIPGGSEEIMFDLMAKQQIRLMKQLGAKL